MNKRTIIFFSIVLLFVIAATYAWMTYNKPHQSVDRVDFSLDAMQLVAEFEADEAAANQKYLDKVIEVNGIVKDILRSDNSVTILLGDPDAMSSVSCAMSPENSPDVEEVKSGASLTIKGICSGMLLDVALVNCEIVH